MRVLVTGAAGFLGRVLVRQLAASHEVLALTRALTPDLPEIAGVTWVANDLSFGFQPQALPQKPDAIIHLAQSNAFRRFPEAADEVFAINVGLVQQLCDYGREIGISRMVLAGTGTVYEPFDGPMTEDQALSPTGHYGATKRAAELISMAYVPYFDVCNLRVFFLYGPGQKDMLIARLIDSVKAGKEVTLPADGKGLVFVPTYVEDAAKGFVTALENGWKGPVNLASPHAASLEDLISEIGKATGKEPNIVLTDQQAPSPIVPDVSRLESLMDIDRFKSIETGIPLAVAGS